MWAQSIFSKMPSACQADFDLIYVTEQHSQAFIWAPPAEKYSDLLLEDYWRCLPQEWSASRSQSSQRKSASGICSGWQSCSMPDSLSCWSKALESCLHGDADSWCLAHPSSLPTLQLWAWALLHLGRCTEEKSACDNKSDVIAGQAWILCILEVRPISQEVTLTTPRGGLFVLLRCTPLLWALRRWSIWYILGASSTYSNSFFGTQVWGKSTEDVLLTYNEGLTHVQLGGSQCAFASSLLCQMWWWPLLPELSVPAAERLQHTAHSHCQKGR